MVLVACSPSLNWRTVQVENLAAQLPCKPDQAERLVDLGGSQRTLSMWGCEADGALFAVSHLRVAAPATPDQAIAAWQLAALRNVPAANPQALPFKAPAPAGQANVPATMLRVSGQRADGQPVQAQLAWLSRGTDVYHIAVFATLLTPAMTESLFTELQWK